MKTYVVIDWKGRTCDRYLAQNKVEAKQRFRQGGYADNLHDNYTLLEGSLYFMSRILVKVGATIVKPLPDGKDSEGNKTYRWECAKDGRQVVCELYQDDFLDVYFGDVPYGEGSLFSDWADLGGAA